jgi:hypothetical protein
MRLAPVGSVVREEHCGKVAERCAHHVGADEPPAPDLAQAALEETYCVRAVRRVRAFRASATRKSASGTSVAVSSRWAMLRPQTSGTLGNVCTAASGRSGLMGESVCLAPHPASKSYRMSGGDAGAAHSSRPILRDLALHETVAWRLLLKASGEGVRVPFAASGSGPGGAAAVLDSALRALERASDGSPFPRPGP